MADDLFRARVEPRRAPLRNELWPDDLDEVADKVLEDLLASFSRHRLELDGRPGPEKHPEPVRGLILDLDDADPSARPRPGTPATIRVEPALFPVIAPRGLPVFKDDSGSAALPSRRATSAGHRLRKPWLIIGTALVVAVGTGTGVEALGSARPDPAATAQNRPTAPSTASTTPTRTPTPSADPAGPATRAADWIAAAVGPGHVVACDVTVCALLRGRGFPDASLITVHSDLGEVEQADVVAVTDVIRGQLGSSLATVIAAEPLAVFASGSSTVQITPVAIGGPADHARRLAADRVARTTAGAALLRNPRITLTVAAGTSLSAGLVDSRVCVLLAVLGGSHDIAVAGFTGAGPGVGSGIPFAGVVISTIDSVDAAGDSPRAAALRGLVAAQQPPYSPLSTTRIAAGADQGLTILFSQPGPIGLLDATTS